MAPLRDNPFDSGSALTSNDPFNLQTQNLSDHILVSWEYTYDNPVVDSYLLYRVNGSDLDTLYTGQETTFIDTTVKWDSTYSYYVTGMINDKETSSPGIDHLKEVVRRIYVGEDGDYTSITDALNSLTDGDVIYVKDGTYKEHIDFNGKAITLKSENGPENCIIDGNGETVITFRGNVDSTAVLDGFTITGGNNNDVYDGGGMTIRSGSHPLIQNCTFTNNSADRGGAVFVREGAKPYFIGCNFVTNTSTEDGGAIFCDRDSKPKIENCIFTGNLSTDGNGGAIAIDEATPQITSCTFNSNQASEGSGGAISMNESQSDIIRLSTFTGNIAKEGGAVYVYQAKNGQFLQCRFENNNGDYGGGIYLEGSGKEANPILFTNCIFWHNEADYEGGAILGTKSDNLYSYLKLDHCTLTGNTVNEGGVSEEGGISIKINNNLTVSNSILWNNTTADDPEIYSLISSSIIVRYSNVDGGWQGEGNINTDPFFEDSIGGDFHLINGSPCIGTGASGTDMGAYGGIFGDWE